MAGRSPHGTYSEDVDLFPEVTLLENPVTCPDAQSAKMRLRQRWELASVLNFLCVFRQVIPKDLKVSAEEVETALITANEDLGQIHIAILKGIPPISNSITDPDAWITLVCKKLATWWSWVAVGETPLKADHGKEILSYKQLDPTTRLLILKALCEVRAEQDDILRFIADELKKGMGVGSFRKERVAASANGITYWYEGDPVIGHRLYREIAIIDTKQKAKGKGSTAKPTFESQWETLATNLEEFGVVADCLSSSKMPGEAYLGERIKTEILPVLENLEKKREKALLRKQRQALQLGSFLNYGVGAIRSCRERRPIRYTFDDYDRSIDEAIKIMEPNSCDSRKANGNMEALNEENSGADENPASSEDKNDMKKFDKISSDDDDDEDDDYVGHGDVDDSDDDDAVNDDDNTADSNSENNNVDSASKPARAKKHLNVKLVSGLRRSSRNTDISTKSNFNDVYHAVTKKRLRQRPTRNTGYMKVISDSEDENPAKKAKQKTEGSSSSGESSAADFSEESAGDHSS